MRGQRDVQRHLTRPRDARRPDGEWRPAPVGAPLVASPRPANRGQGTPAGAAPLGHTFGQIALYPAAHSTESIVADPAPLQRRGEGRPAGAATADLAGRIRAAAGGGSALPVAVQRQLEHGLGADLSGVRLHTDGEADRLARTVGAVAFTTGPDIFFRSGAYQPATEEGQRLLAHEATHVIQQAAGPVAGTPAPGGVTISDPSDPFERAATAAVQRATLSDAGPERALTPGGASAGGHGALPIQRRFGFEVETDIGLRSIADATFVKKNAPVWQKNKPTKSTPIAVHPAVNADDSVATGQPHFQIKVDHHRGHGLTDPDLTDWDLDRASVAVLAAPAPNQVATALEYDEPEFDALRGPIAEFVIYPPLDEFNDTENDVRVAMTGMGQKALELLHAPLRAPLADYYAGAVPSTRVGVKGKSSRIVDINKSVAIQTTTGIQLPQIERYLREMSGPALAIADPGGGKAWKSPGKATITQFVEQLAIRNGRAVFTTLGHDPALHPEWVGPMILLSQYLVSSHYAAELGFGWGKNKVGMFFYKGKLSELFVGVDPATADQYRQALLDVNRVDEHALIAGIEAGAWLTEVLTGADDKVFEALKNPYSAAIAPEAIGAETGFVMEKRKGGPPLLAGATWTPSELGTSAAAWGNLGVLVYRFLRALHGVV